MTNLHTIRGGQSPQRSDAKDALKIEHISTNDTDDLTNALTDAERIASILSTLLNDRIIDTGNRRYFTVGRQDAEDIRFAAGQLLAMLVRTGEIWRKLP